MLNDTIVVQWCSGCASRPATMTVDSEIGQYHFCDECFGRLKGVDSNE